MLEPQLALQSTGAMACIYMPTPLNQKILLSLYLHPQPPPITHLLPKVRHVEHDGGTHIDAMVRCVGHNGWVYLTQWWGHVGRNSQACWKMQRSGVWDATVGCI